MGKFLTPFFEINASFLSGLIWSDILILVAYLILRWDPERLRSLLKVSNTILIICSVAFLLSFLFLVISNIYPAKNDFERSAFTNRALGPYWYTYLFNYSAPLIGLLIIYKKKRRDNIKATLVVIFLYLLFNPVASFMLQLFMAWYKQNHFEQFSYPHSNLNDLITKSIFNLTISTGIALILTIIIQKNALKRKNTLS